LTVIFVLLKNAYYRRDTIEERVPPEGYVLLKNAYHRRDTDRRDTYHKQKNHHSTPGCHGGQFPLALVGEIMNKTPTF
jgi:hypothetical protein